MNLSLYLDYFKSKKLLLSNGNVKIIKNEIPTHYLSLLPHTLNSKRVSLCPYSTKECREVCLNYSGKGIFSNVIKGRSMRTEFLINFEEEFVKRLGLELTKLNSKGVFLIRLNTFSDIDWRSLFKTYSIDMEQWSNLIFYNYTKVPSIMYNKAKNEEIVFSFSGKNWGECENILNSKVGNVSVVFKDGLPSTYKGFEVINGDESDMRLSSIEGTGKIIGLRFKIPKHKKVDINNYSFVV